MKNKFVYFLVGGLLIGLVLVVFQITQASPGIPNPGHELSCHVVSAQGEVGTTDAEVYCDTGTLTGGGCRRSQYPYSVHASFPNNNGWHCGVEAQAACKPTAYAICCEAI